MFLLPPTVGLRKVSDHWFACRDGNESARELFHRHYSYRHYKDGRLPVLFVGPGQKMVLLTEDSDALFVLRIFRSGDGNEGINCAVFRNESQVKSSVLILDAETAAWTRWPRQRLYTYVNARKIRSKNPGACFKKAGWRTCGITKWNKLVILEKEAE